jgi:hypothetical protein
MSSRLKAAKAVITGKLPERIIEKPTVVHEVQVIHLRTGRRQPKESKGTVDISRTWTDKRPHPAIMSKLDELNNDPELETAITIMTEMIASGFYTEMGAQVPKQTDAQGKEIVHPHKLKVDAWNEAINADEKIAEAVRVMLEKGFVAIEIIPEENNDLKVLPSQTMFIWQDKKGKVTKYTQDVGGSQVAEWKGADAKNILWWANKATPENPYGKPMALCLEPFLEARKEMTNDGPAVLHKVGYPLRRWESRTKETMDKVFTQATNRDPDEDLFIDGVEEGDLRVVTEQTNARINFEGFLTSNNQMIAEGLFSPLMNYLRNATEASATKMLEAIDRHVQGIQRYVKRRTEQVFGRICGGDPIPRMVWGSPRSGVEQVAYADIASLYNGGNGCITFDQAQDLIKKLGLPLKDLPEGQTGPMPPSLKDMPLLDQTRMTTLQASLNVIEQNWKAKTIDIATAFREGNRVIKVHIDASRQEAIRKLNQAGVICKGLSPESENCFQVISSELTAAFRQKLLPHGAHQDVTAGTGKRFTVISH